MLVFGLQSSVFDYLTFYVLFKVYKVNADHFRTGWFVESILTELLILFIIRTSHLFFKSMPGKMLMISSLAAFIVTFWLPYSPLAPVLGLDALPMRLLISITAITIVYALTAEALKMYFFRKMRTLNSKPR